MKTQFEDITIVDAKGWNLEQEIPEYDYRVLESNICIPINYGLGIRVFYEEKYYTFVFEPRRKPIVELQIRTWRGMSGGAIHYYGTFIFMLPIMVEDGTDGHSIGGSSKIPMFTNYKIKLMQQLEQWEKEKYPENYEYNDIGDWHRGFYTVEGVLRRAVEVFPKIFAEGWKMKIEKQF
jgi:hypothetical protein